ncbi:unnamed protein product [Schistosoma margrebowiei]|uniref:Uncharacterized protein n=1 Tax=Schistosoma margrebowiei TaxID=48269 RepID=A0A183MF63_9TREM|nr:unnamed protein product [Schistosoma margrebowiei]
MQCDDCKDWFYEVCTDVTATAYNRLGKSDQRWVCITCSTDAAVTDLRNKLPANLDNGSKKTSKQTRVRNEHKIRDVGKYTIDGSSITTNDDGNMLNESNHDKKSGAVLIDDDFSNDPVLSNDILNKFEENTSEESNPDVMSNIINPLYVFVSCGKLV